MNVALCLPSHGPPFRKHLRSVDALLRAEPSWFRLEHSGPNCDLVRSILAMAAIADKADVIVMADADMTFSVDAAQTIVREADARQALVGCLYLGKKRGGEPQVSLLPGTKELRCYEGGSVFEVNAIGFGLVAFPVSMLTAMVERLGMVAQRVGERLYFPWWSNDCSHNLMHSDDYSFCRRARLSGFRNFADSRHRVGHLGEHEYFLEDAAPRELALDFLMRGEEPQKEAAE
jgi:hypothetical protein